MLRYLSIVFALERTNQLSLLPDKNLVDLCHPIEPYQVTKNQINNLLESEDREVFMALSQSYLEWKEATKREGLQQGLQRSSYHRWSLVVYYWSLHGKI